VTVTPSAVTILKGNIQYFGAAVLGTNVPEQTVTWSVTGGITGTSIDGNGLLTVAANETASTLTVTASSKMDTTKSGTAIVTVQTPSTILGDINSDGQIDSLDYELIKKHLLRLETIQNTKLADLDGDGAIDSMDFALMKQYLLGMITKFPAGCN
ncbi:MAG TPA: dockerin type I domain-containing protein, partial [Clostridia bacterium]|nr:dockerin type I domain-containing protein [Clostridia bacterium]